MFIDEKINQCSGFGFIGGPNFKTRIVALRNFRESRNGDCVIARHAYRASYLNIGADGLKDVRRMFYVCRGRLHCFRFTDPTDDTALDEPFAEGDGVRTVFQLVKQSEADGILYERHVALPVGATIEANGVAVAPAINLETGVVTFAVAPADGALLTWSGSFDVKVRFDQDELPFSLDNPNAYNGSVGLIEVLDGQ